MVPVEQFCHSPYFAQHFQRFTTPSLINSRISARTLSAAVLVQSGVFGEMPERKPRARSISRSKASGRYVSDFQIANPVNRP